MSFILQRDAYEHLLHQTRDAPGIDLAALDALRVQARRRGDWRGELVGLALGEPSPWAWKAICELVECMNERELTAWHAWLMAALDAHWPHTLRSLPERWVRDYLERRDPRLISLARTARLARGTLAPEVVFEQPLFDGLRVLIVEPRALGWRVLGESLRAAHHLRGLERLSVPHHGDHGEPIDFGRVLAVFPALTHLRAPLGAADLRWLAEHHALRALDLHGWGPAASLLEALVENRLLARLERLGLRHRSVCWDCVDILTTRGNRLVHLDVSHSRLTPRALQVLLESPNLRTVRTLRAARHGGWPFSDPRLDPCNFVPDWLGDG